VTKHLTDKEFLNVIDVTPLVSIDLVIRNENSQVLLGYRNNCPAQHYWFVPGGRVRKNERITAAFQRLCQTELRLDLSLEKARFLGVYEHLYADNFIGKPGITTHYVVLGYELRLQSSDSVELDDQHSQQHWWGEAELLSSSKVHANTKAYFDDDFC